MYDFITNERLQIGSEIKLNLEKKKGKQQAEILILGFRSCRK